MITVIIPTLNEEKTIRQVIEPAANSPLVTESFGSNYGNGVKYLLSNY